MGIHQVFAADVKDLKLTFTQPDAWENTLFKYDEKRVRIVIKPLSDGDHIRSLDANAYYWGVVVNILCNDDIIGGIEDYEMHDALGRLFRTDYTKILPVIKRTSTMSSREFWDYINRVRAWAAVEYFINIPDPNKVEVD